MIRSCNVASKAGTLALLLVAAGSCQQAGPPQTIATAAPPSSSAAEAHVSDQECANAGSEHCAPGPDAPEVAIEVTRTASGAFAFEGGVGFEGQAPMGMFGELAEQSPETWGELTVWSNTWDAGPRQSRALFACGQRHYSDQRGSCSYKISLGVMSGLVSFVRIETSAGRAADEHGELFDDQEAQARCEDYVACLAEYAWLGRIAPTPDTVPKEYLASLRATLTWRGARSVVTEKWARLVIDDVELQLAPELASIGLDEILRRTPTSRREIQVKQTARYMRLAQWVLEIRPWENWDEFMAESLRHTKAERE